MFSLQLAQRWALEAMRHGQARELRWLCLSVCHQQNTESLWTVKDCSQGLFYSLCFLPMNVSVFIQVLGDV